MLNLKFQAVLLGLLLLSVAISGCQSTKYVTREVPVEVTKVEYKPIPPACLQSCPAEPNPIVKGDPNSLLRDAYQGWQLRAGCLAERLACVDRAVIATVN